MGCPTRSRCISTKTPPVDGKAMKTSIRISVALASLAAFGAVPVASEAASVPPGPKWYRHRGHCGGYTENGYKAFRCSVNRGDHIETDFRFTIGVVPIIMHDSTLNRTTNCTGYVSKRTWAYVDKCKLNDRSEVPPLRGYVSFIKPTGRWSLIDLKAMPTSTQWARLADRLGPIKSRVIFYSSHSDSYVKAAKARGYRAAKFHLWQGVQRSVSTMKSVGTGYYLNNSTSASREAYYARHGIKVLKIN